MKTKPVIDKNPRNNEEIIASPEEKEGIAWIKTSILKMEYCKIFKLLNNSPVSKFVAKNGSK